MRWNIVTVAVVVAVALATLTLGYARWRTTSRAAQGGKVVPSTKAAAHDSDGATKSAVSSPAPQPGGGTNSPSSAALGEVTLPAALLSVIDAPKVGTGPKEAAALAGGRQAALIEAYRATDTIDKKSKIARLLAHVGDEQVVSLLTNALTREHVGRELTRYEGQSLGQVAECLGFLARRYDSAFNFLMQGIEPAFWSQQPGPSGAYVSIRGFSGDCLRGLAVSRRPEVPAVFDSVRARSTGTVARALSGSLVDAAFLYQMQQQYGDRWDNGEVYRRGDFDAYMRLFVEWGQTAEGRDWRRWSQSAKGIEDRMVKPPRARP